MQEFILLALSQRSPYHPGLQIACRPSHAPSGRAGVVEGGAGGCAADAGLR